MIFVEFEVAVLDSQRAVLCFVLRWLLLIVFCCMSLSFDSHQAISQEAMKSSLKHIRAASSRQRDFS